MTRQATRLLAALAAAPERRQAAMIALLLVVGIGMLYVPRLDSSPVYLVHDEVIYALNAHSIATTARDINGQFLPVSIYVVGTFFATPVQIYFTALFLKLAPLTEVTIRLPTVIVGLANIVLVYLIGRRIFRRGSFAVLAALVLAVTPAYFIHSRMATDHLYLVTFVLAWLWCLLGIKSGTQLRSLFLATGFLGLSIYTYLGALIAAPVCLLLTFVALRHLGARSPRPYLAAIAGFAVPLIPFVLWHLAHPEQYARQIQMYGLYDSTRLTAAQGARELMSWASLTERSSVYWDYFSPSFLFFAGDTGLINGTRYTGVLLWPLMVLLPIGVYSLIASPRSTVSLLLLLGLLTSPLAAALVAERYRINRALLMLPFAALVATVAVEALWDSRQKIGRAIAVALLVAMPIQFAGFYRDYFGDYRVRSYPWFEYNIRGGMEDIIARQAAAPAPIYVARNIQWADYYWPLYLAKHERMDLRPHTNFLDLQAADTIAAIAGGSLALCRASDEAILIGAGFHRLQSIHEPDGTHSFSVLQK